MSFEHMNGKQLADLIKDPSKALTLVDIRDRQSFDSGHIEGAFHVDNSSLPDFLRQADKLKPLVVYCYHGNSSQGAADYFNEMGFHEVYSLDGGYEDWKQGTETI
ncbi:MAG: thiosulfate sulfurtransferase GlpE [Oleiphilus sp.]|nr:MAG: thiosulfate sulfurtransferase GlpE [Oleiphilus sp.]